MGDQNAMQAGELSARLSARLKELEELDQAVLPRRTPGATGAGFETMTSQAPRGLVPVPRRARVFLRHGEGHGSFADLTVTAPPTRHTTV